MSLDLVPVEPMQTTDVITDNGKQYVMCVCGWYSPPGTVVCNREMHSHMQRRRNEGCTHGTTGKSTMGIKLPYTRRQAADGTLRCSGCGLAVAR